MSKGHLIRVEIVKNHLGFASRHGNHRPPLPADPYLILQVACNLFVLERYVDRNVFSQVRTIAWKR